MSLSGARASAALYSLIESAKANSIEPYGYLLAVFTRLPQISGDADLDDLLPWNYKDSLLALVAAPVDGVAAPLTLDRCAELYRRLQA